MSGSRAEIDEAKEAGSFMEIPLNSRQMNEFQKALKRGIYRELYEKELLTGSQLACLLNHI